MLFCLELSLNLIPNKINISIGSFLQSVCFSASIIEFRLNRKAAIGLFIDWFLFSDSILILVFLVIFCTVLYVLYYSFLFLLMIFAYFTFGNFHLVLAMFFICILAESNRVPFDLPEAESELVAGFITEYSSIYFSLILLTEYANIIGMSFWMIILFSIFPLSLLLVLFFVCLIRSTLNYSSLISKFKEKRLLQGHYKVAIPLLGVKIILWPMFFLTYQLLDSLLKKALSLL